jgi:hypothetical protein
LTLTLELDVSALGIGDTLATYSLRSASAASTDLWGRPCKPDCLVGHFSSRYPLIYEGSCFALPTSLFGSHHSQTSFD